MIQSPVILDDVFTQKQRDLLMLETAMTPNNQIEWDDERSRTISVYNRFSKFSLMLLPLARQVFGSDTLLPSYALWARYMGAGGYLERHKDSNACTYTIDYCLNQFEPWPLIVEDVSFTLHPNQALAFRGEDLLHWRPTWKPGNIVEMLFFHYVEPDHWWFTGEGGQYDPGAAGLRGIE